MQKNQHDSLEFYPQPSFSLRLFIYGAHGLALLLLLYLTMRQPWLGLLLPLLLLSLLHNLRKQGLNHPHRIRRVLWRGQGQWRWQYADGRTVEGAHLASSLRLSWLVILNLREAQSGAVRRLLLPRDSVAARQHRRLRVVLALPLN